MPKTDAARLSDEETNEQRLKNELGAMNRLYALHGSLATETDLQTALGQIVAAAADLTHTDRGCIQLVSDDGERFEFFTCQGFRPDSPFIQHILHEGAKPICDAARQDRQRKIIEDVATSPELAGTDDREVALSDDIRAMQLTPMITRRGEVVGVLSTQFRKPYRPTDEELRLIDLLAWSAADFVERQMTDQRLRESEERFRGLVDSVAQATWETDSEGIIDSDSPSLRAFTGQTREEWLGNGWINAIHPEDRPGFVEYYRQAVAAGSAINAECRVQHAGKGYRWTNVRAVPIRDVDGHIRKWVGMNIDIDATKRAEDSLRESEERLAAIFESLPVGVGLFDLQGNIVLSNAEMDRYMPSGVIPSRDETGTYRIQAWDAAGRNLERSEFPGARALRGETVLPGTEFLFRLDDGREVWIRLSAVPMRDNQDQITGAIGVITDIDDVKRGELALSDSEERFRGFAEASADVLWIVEAGSRQLEYLSPAFAQIWGVDREVVMRDFRGLTRTVHPDDLVEFESILPRVIDGETVIMEYRLIRPTDRSIRWIRDTGFPIRDHHGQVTHAAGIAQDVTDIKRAEVERQTFVDAAAHDLKTPLTALRGQTQLLLRRARRGKLEDAAMLESRLRQIDNAGARMLASIDEMMDAAHIRADRPLELKLGPVDLVELVSGMVDDARHGTGRHQVRVRTDQPSLIGAWDSARLSRVLDNLIDNAIKYSPEGGDVIVEIEREQDTDGSDWATVRVCDQGIGIPGADLPHLFQRFQRAGNVAKFRGAGIGLAGSRQIVQQHGGTLTAESEEGHGSVFTVHLPLAPPGER